jgi:cephalosporin hydroxylase
MIDPSLPPAADEASERALFDRVYALLWHKPGCSLQFDWLGVRTGKCPTDVIQYQEIIVAQRPEFIIETGTAFGGSALFFASICDLVGSGQVITIDSDGTRVADAMRRHPRVTCLTGDSCSPDVLRALAHRVGGSTRTMAILDSAHDAPHVLRELVLYSGFIGLGQYLVVEDGTVNGNPILPEHGPGPREAIQQFLARPSFHQFAMERDRETRFGLSNVRDGFLRRIV